MPRPSSSDAVLVGLFGIVMLVIVTTLMIVVSGGCLMLAWNLLVPTVFHGPPLTFMAAIGASILLSCLRGLVTMTVKMAKK